MNNNFVFSTFPIIETERLILRQINISDINEMYNIFSSETVMKYYGAFPFKEKEHVEDLINSMNEGFKNNIAIRWGIELKSEKILIGTCGFHSWNKRAARAEIGYELCKDYWGQGLMSEAIGAITSYGFNTMGLNRIEALVYPEHNGSKLILLRNGFKEEGLLREYLYLRDKYQDLVVFSLLKNEKFNNNL